MDPIPLHLSPVSNVMFYVPDDTGKMTGFISTRHWSHYGMADKFDTNNWSDNYRNHPPFSQLGLYDGFTEYISCCMYIYLRPLIDDPHLVNRTYLTMVTMGVPGEGYFSYRRLMIDLTIPDTVDKLKEELRPIKMLHLAAFMWCHLLSGRMCEVEVDLEQRNLPIIRTKCPFLKVSEYSCHKHRGRRDMPGLTDRSLKKEIVDLNRTLLKGVCYEGQNNTPQYLGRRSFDDAWARFGQEDQLACHYLIGEFSTIKKQVRVVIGAKWDSYYEECVEKAQRPLKPRKDERGEYQYYKDGTPKYFLSLSI